jgi:hypothetical protein
MKYTIFDKKTGEILRIVSCAPDDLALQFDDATQGSLDGGIDDATHYIENGEPVAFPFRPSPEHTFNWTTKQWIDSRTLTDVKATQWSAIKVAREAAITKPLVTPYGTFDATPGAQKSITDAVLMLQTLESMGTPETIDFTLADNTTATLTTQQMVHVGLLLGAQTQTAYTVGRGLRAQIEAATSIADVEAITWPT